MSSSTRFISGIYFDRENMEVEKSNILSTKVVRPANWVNSVGFYLKVFKKIKHLKSLEGILPILSTC